MRKRLLQVGIVAVAALALLFSVQAAFAAGPFGGPRQAPPDDGAWCHGAGGMMGGGYMMGGGVHIQNVARTLNTDIDTLLAELRSGKTLLEIAEARGVGEDALVEAIIAPQRDMLEIQVKYGVLTPDEADTILTQHTERVRELIKTQGGFGAGSDHMGGGKGMRGTGGMMGGGSGMMGGYGAGGFGRGMMGSWR